MTDKSYLLGYVLASEYRKKVMTALRENPLTPSGLSDKIEMHQSHVSQTLSELSQKKLVVCLTPKLKKGRLYELTKEGQNLLKKL